MSRKRTAKFMTHLAVFMVAPALGAATGAQAGEQTAGTSAPAEQGISFAQVEFAGPMGPYGGPPGPMGPQGAPPYAGGGPWGGPEGGGPGGGGPAFGYGPPDPRAMMGPAMMPGQGGPSGPMMGMGGGDKYGMASVMQAWQLPDLTEEQRSKLRSIAQDLRKKHWDLKGAMMEESDKLAQLWAAESVDANAVGEAYGRLFELQRQWIVSTIETRQQVDDVLTGEQKQWLQGRSPMPGAPFPMMRGMMPGMQGVPGGSPTAPKSGAQSGGGQAQGGEASGSGAPQRPAGPQSGMQPTTK
ncbi:MAG: Spy/CpxP family protein refolding chaperone [Gammaproteobacteria bacterium]